MIDSLRENPPPNSVVLSFDEKGRTPVKEFSGRKWTIDENYRIPYSQKVKSLVDIFAAKNIHTEKRHYGFYDWKNSFTVIDFVSKLLNDVYTDKEIYLILDGWSAHKSGAFHAFADLQSRLHLVPLPRCASWMNDIERDFSRLQLEVLDNSNFANPRELIDVVSAFFEKVLNSS